MLSEIAICVACQGSGKRSSDGLPCVPCGGTGKNPKALSPNLAPYHAAFGDRETQLTEANDSLAMLEQIRINTESEYIQAGEWLRTCKAVGKQYEEKRKDITGPLNQAKREVDSWFKPVVSTWQRAEQILKTKIQDYQARQLVQRQTIAQQMQANQSNVPATMALAAQAQRTMMPKLEGVQTRRLLRWRIVDANVIPRQFLIVDSQAVNVAMRTEQQIPGIEYYYEETLIAKI